MPHKNKEEGQDYKLKVRYGLSLLEFDSLREKQNDTCPGCLKKKQLCVDHCHETGMIRGLLCRQCNATIGIAGESLQRLKNIVAYLEKA